MLKNKSTRLFLLLGGFFIANALIAEVIGVKIFSLEDSIGIPRAQLNLFGSSFIVQLSSYSGCIIMACCIYYDGYY